MDSLSADTCSAAKAELRSGRQRSLAVGAHGHRLIDRRRVTYGRRAITGLLRRGRRLREALRAFDSEAVSIRDCRDRKHQRPGGEQPYITDIAPDRGYQLNQEGEEYEHQKTALRQLAAGAYRIGDTEIALDYQRRREE